MSERTPVLVVGAGLAGLASALFLTWHGVPCQVVERHRSISGHPRARGIHPYAMELMRTAGLEEAIRSTPSALALAGNHGVIAVQSLAGAQIGALREAYFLDSRPDLDSLSPTGWCLCHQDEYEPILLQRALAQGAQVHFGTELVSFTAQSDGDGELTAVLREREHGTTRTVRTRFLVAADGPASTVRDRLGVATDGTPTLGHYLNIHFEADLVQPLGDRRFIMCYTFNPAIRGALMPLDNAHRWLLHVIYDPATEPPESFTPQRCVELVRLAAGLSDLSVRIIGVLPWAASGRVAGNFQRGNVFLVGDAAHVMPPSGAFGSNTGIADAYNLSWKIAAVLAGRAGPGLLDSYDAERRPVADGTVTQAVLRSRDRPRLLHETPAPPDPAIVPDSTVWFGWRYRSGAVLAEPVPGDGCDAPGPWAPGAAGAPGTRAAHLALLRSGTQVSTVDLFGRDFVLLAGANGAPWCAAARQAGQRLGVPVRAYRLTSGTLSDHAGTDPASGEPLMDPTGGWPARYGVGADGAVLVRPDGVVAWRAGRAGTDPAGTLSTALSTVLSR